MALKLMYITNRPEVALIAERSGVDRVFVDMEYIGKDERQGKLDSVKNRHTVEDVERIRQVITKSDLLVRVNPIHDAAGDHCSSEDEIEAVIKAGADIVMLPFFKTATEAERFLSAVGGRSRTMLLLETPEAVDALDDILALKGIDEIHIGINDLSIGYGKSFMFELLTDGTVERLCRKLQAAGKTYGFGGIARLGRGAVPAEMIVREHYRLGSQIAILSRSFCNTDQMNDPGLIEEIFSRGVKELRALEAECEEHIRYFSDNRKELKRAVESAVQQLDRKKEDRSCTS